MKNIRNYRYAALLLGSAVVSTSAHAATIVWSSTAYVNTGTNKDTLGTGQFDTTGTILYAENNGGSALTFDGINFSAGLATASYFGGGNFAAFYNAGGALAHTGTTAPNNGPFLTAVNLGEGGVGPTTFEVGKAYMIQVLIFDSRTAYAGRRVSFDGVNQGVYANASGSNLGDGLLVTGTFTADATSQSFDISTFQPNGMLKGGQINAMIISLAPPAAPPFDLIITPNATPGLYDFSWDSQPGKVYDLVTSTDLATPILIWPVHDPDGEGGNPPYADISATGTTTTLTEVPGDGPKRFFAIVEKDAPPIFTADFETDGAGFTQVGTPNDWSWGTPNSNNNATPPLVLTTGNDGSVGAWATNLGAGGTPPSGTIDPVADSILRSPEIDLTGIAGAQISFAAAYDFAVGDVIEIVVKEVGTADPLGDPISPVAGPFPKSSNWTDLGPFPLPAAADNKNIYLEFRYHGTDANFIGLYIDDVTVTR